MRKKSKEKKIKKLSQLQIEYTRVLFSPLIMEKVQSEFERI